MSISKGIGANSDDAFQTQHMFATFPSGLLLFCSMGGLSVHLIGQVHSKTTTFRILFTNTRPVFNLVTINPSISLSPHDCINLCPLKKCLAGANKA